MNRLMRAAIVGGAALAVGIVPAASVATAAVAPTPPPVTTVTSPPITPVPGVHLPGGHRTPGSHKPGRHKPVSPGSHGGRGSGDPSGSTGSGTSGSGHRSGSHRGGSHSGSHGGSHGTGSHSGSHGRGSSGRGSTGSGHRTPVHQPPKPTAPVKPSKPVKPVASPKPTPVPRPGKSAPRPRIFGGADATNAPWAAQVSWNSMGFECSGSIVAPSWVLTAGHCASEDGMTVRVGSLQFGGGDQVAVDALQVDPDADLALLHLANPVTAPSVTLASADPKVGAINEIYGWGMTAPDSGPAPQLKVAKVKVTALDCVDAAQGRAICSTGINGSAYNGDSGGPEMSDGQEVGVCSTGDQDAKSQQYASVAANRTWIKQVAGV